MVEHSRSPGVDVDEDGPVPPRSSWRGEGFEGRNGTSVGVRGEVRWTVATRGRDHLDRKNPPDSSSDRVRFRKDYPNNDDS